MSDANDCTVDRNDMAASQTPMGVPSFSHQDAQVIKGPDASLDDSTYILGEVPQSYLTDPYAFLPLNSECLLGAMNVIKGILAELGTLIDEELKEVSKLQRQIQVWEEKILRNHAITDKNLNQIKKNLIDLSYDGKNRDYWIGREQQVLSDYAKAESGGKPENWAWLIRKYGLKNPDGTPVDHLSKCVGELCNGAANNLATEYKWTALRYEQALKHKEANNVLLAGMNDKLAATNEELQKYIANMHANEIEPLQDGVLLFKELGLKLRTLERQESPAKFGDLRSWAESFLDEFLRENCFVPQRVVNAFRRMASIPLPAQNS